MTAVNLLTAIALGAALYHDRRPIMSIHGCPRLSRSVGWRCCILSRAIMRRVPPVGDRVRYRVRLNPKNGQREAVEIAPKAAATCAAHAAGVILQCCLI
jgi:hypothetical protein